MIHQFAPGAHEECGEGRCIEKKSGRIHFLPSGERLTGGKPEHKNN